MPHAHLISLCHGGGPLPLLNDPDHAQITSSLRTKVPQLLHLGTNQAPKAILIISAHWGTPSPTISCPKKPALMYDYSEFPPEAYDIKYDVPTSLEVAREVFAALESAGLQARMERDRAWDHGAFVPMALIDPTARIPILQLSVLSSESATDLLTMGLALRPLRGKNIAIIGFGSPSFHNPRAYFSGQTKTAGFRSNATAFSEAMDKAVEMESVVERKKYLEGWRAWEGSYEMHPSSGSEHFSPFLVCAGAAGEGVGEKWTDEFLGLDNKGNYWL